MHSFSESVSCDNRRRSNSKRQNVIAHSGTSFSQILSIQLASMINGQAKKKRIKNESLELENAIRIMDVKSWLPDFFPMTGFTAINMLLEKTISCPDTWLATPCAALMAVPKKLFTTMLLPYTANMEVKVVSMLKLANDNILLANLKSMFFLRWRAHSEYLW